MCHMYSTHSSLARIIYKEYYDHDYEELSEDYSEFTYGLMGQNTEICERFLLYRVVSLTTIMDLAVTDDS